MSSAFRPRPRPTRCHREYPGRLALLLLAVALGWVEPSRAELVAFYAFDDPANPMADSSGNDRHLTSTAGTNPVWASTNGFGGTGAYDFSADRLIAPINVNPAAMPRMTWGAWVRTDSTVSGLRKVIGHDDGGWDRTIGIDNRNPATVRYTSFTGDNAVNNSGPVEGTPGPLNTTNWTFLAASYDQTARTVTMYIDLDANTTNDALVAITEPGAFGTGFITFAIGGIRPDNNSEAWDGVIDNVFIYNEVLDAAAVTTLRNSHRITRPPRINAFAAAPGHIASGQSTRLSWNTTDADSLSIDEGVGAISGAAGSVLASPGTTTTYTLTASNGAGSVTAQVTVGVDVVVLPPRITEFMASNGGSLSDGDGNSSDWIEIHNPNPFAISLAGYALQDSATSWVMPDFPIASGTFLIVFASGQEPNYIDAGGFLHSPFQVSAAGEVLRLLDIDGQTVLSQFTGVPAQRNDVSWGIDPNTGAQGFFVPPTPGRANGTALVGFVADTKFDFDRGFYDAPITVTITCATADASIAYTIDGTEPSPTHGTIVGAPAGQTPAATVLINATTTLRARAFRAGWVSTGMDTHTYLFLGKVIDQPATPPGFPTTWGVFTGSNGSVPGTPVPADYEMKPAIVNANRPGLIAALRSLPTLSIVADPADLFGSEGILPNPFGDVDGSGVHTQSPFVPDRRCSVEWIQPDGARELQINCAVRLIGGWSRHYEATPKKSLRLSFQSEFGPTKLKFPLFGDDEIDEFDRVLLRATFSDGWVDNAHPAQFLRDPFVRETYLAMGEPGARGTFVHLYLNGLYWGIYNPTERPDADYASSHYGGADVEYDALKHEGLRGPGQAPTDSYEVIDGTAERWDAALAITAGNMADPTVYARFKQYVDVVSLADYVIVNSFLSNMDWPGKNWYAFGRRDAADGGFKFSPWDSEYTLLELGANRTEVSSTITPARFYDRARTNPEFRLLFADRLRKHAFNGGPLTTPAMVARYSAMAAHLEPAIDAEAARWGDNPNTRQGIRDYRKSDWIAARDQILNSYFPNRPPIALPQYRSLGLYPAVDAPDFTQHGGVIDPPQIQFVGPPAGTIYYTTDGSDPRLAGGTVNPLSVGIAGGSVTQSFVGFEATGWRYFVTPTGLGDSELADGNPPHPGYDAGNWKHPDFDDSAWPTGQAMLGYGVVGARIMRTTIGFGGDPAHVYPSTYFRKQFNVANASLIGALRLDLIRDDGAILYVNGREVGRSTMRSGNQRYEDMASAEANPEGQVIRLSYILPPGLLRDGVNVLAVELHQRTANDTDLGIDVGIQGLSATAPIPLTGSGTVKARLRLPSGQWSALTEAFFIVAAEPASSANVVVSKIHYHPAPPTPSEIAAGFDNQRDFEYIELMNYRSRSIDLAGVEFADGISFKFDPGIPVQLAPNERAVLVGNRAAFALRYGGGVRVLGEFQTGNLSNEGESIALLAANLSVIWRFAYDDAGAWPASPDGFGPALALVDPDHPPDNVGMSSPENWRPSVEVGGSPGTDDRVSFAAWLASRPNHDPLADPDGDGINQLVAFAIGALTTTPAHAFLPSLSLQTFNVGGTVNRYPVIHVREWIGAQGVSMGIENSANLRSWAPASLTLVSVSEHGDGSMTRHFRAATAAQAPTSFLRVSVSEVP